MCDLRMSSDQRKLFVLVSHGSITNFLSVQSPVEISSGMEGGSDDNSS